MTNRTTPFAGPLFIEDDNLSLAWGRVVRHITEHVGKEVSPLIISITGFDKNGIANEIPEIRDCLDKLLEKQEKLPIEKVAFTVFPQRYWIMSNGDRHKLFKMYKKAYPRLQKMHSANKYGLYFERLIMFPEAPNNGNQLETIIDRFARPNGQRMQRQACTYDPKRDQSGTAIQGFPCLQHVTFCDTTEGLVINAFYATQQLFVRAYGNFLGLTHLGAFMGKEISHKLARLNVFIGIEKLDDIPKTDPKIMEIVELVNQYREERP